MAPKNSFGLDVLPLFIYAINFPWTEINPQSVQQSGSVDAPGLLSKYYTFLSSNFFSFEKKSPNIPPLRLKIATYCDLMTKCTPMLLKLISVEGISRSQLNLVSSNNAYIYLAACHFRQVSSEQNECTSLSNHPSKLEYYSYLKLI